MKTKKNNNRIKKLVYHDCPVSDFGIITSNEKSHHENGIKVITKAKIDGIYLK